MLLKINTMYTDDDFVVDLWRKLIALVTSR